MKLEGRRSQTEQRTWVGQYIEFFYYYLKEKEKMKSNSDAY